MHEVSRRTLLQYSGIALTGITAGCSTPTGRSASSSIPVFLENRGFEQHSSLVEVTGTSNEKAFNEEITVAPDTIVKVTDVGTEEFCLRARVPAIDDGLDSTCPSRGEDDHSENGYLIVIRDTTSAKEMERQRVVIEKILDANIRQS